VPKSDEPETTRWRIAMTSLYLPGSSKIGVGHQVHRFANEMVRRGHDVTVFSPSRTGPGAEYALHAIDPGTSARTFRFAWRLRDVDFSSFDILHAHGDDTFLAGTRRPPHVRTVHGSCLCEALHIRGAKERARMALLGAGEMVSTAIADRCVAVSGATARTYPWIRHVIPNGVDVRRLGKPHPSGRTEAPTILFVGTLRNRKRGHLLVDAFERTVRPAIPESRLWMVCTDAPDGAGIEVLGNLSDDQLIERYQRAWVFCLPSSYEGFGLPYVEAMAAGCPVVATSNPGAAEVLAGGRYGRIVPPERIGASLVELLRDPAKRDELSARGRTHAQEYDWEVVCRAYEAVYESVLNTAARRVLAS
jgi:glycosyltransferase involved in cell wall biosynthesis